VPSVRGRDEGGDWLFPFPQATPPPTPREAWWTLGDGFVAGVVGSGLWKDGSGRALDGGTTVMCDDYFSLLGVVQCAAAMASSVGCGPLGAGVLVAFMAGVQRDLGRCGQRPWRWCAVRRVQVATSSAEGAQHRWHLPQRGMVSLLKHVDYGRGGGQSRWVSGGEAGAEQ
jgi:hypothetical protein